MSSPHPSSPHSVLHNSSSHFHCIIRVEYPSTTHPPPTQCCEAHRQSLHQSFGHLYPLSPSPSPINGYISAVHSSHNAFRVVYGQSAHPRTIHVDAPSYYCIH
ncbi:hypothetical protein T12_4481 [Trichinella patagoniensis]|uniref:Uncharacterized protein n=1 Tax=Trichinella patagoniensis TaxID=990121 RepID=A0A0V1A1F8_9BILA|nr:hypothetical protein T12_7559 [Trichinella patagoniensis]KRY18302.1 hypothetical protein T12_4481 [Trichinella patagoniensis]